jgi:hypothetical protein
MEMPTRNAWPGVDDAGYINMAAAELPATAREENLSAGRQTPMSAIEPACDCRKRRGVARIIPTTLDLRLSKPKGYAECEKWRKIPLRSCGTTSILYSWGIPRLSIYC